MAEIRRELTDVVGPRPPSEAELASAQDQATLPLPGRWETLEAVAADIGELVRFSLPDDHWNRYAARVRALDLAQVTAAARALVAPERLVWLVVGDAAAIEPGLRAAGFPAPHRLDADGNSARPPAEAEAQRGEAERSRTD
jgi:zinc protease